MLEQRDGEQLLQNYIDLGLQLTKADNGVEAGLFDVWERLSTGRLKVFRTLQSWLGEYRLYRRDEKGAVEAMNAILNAAEANLRTAIGTQ